MTDVCAIICPKCESDQVAIVDSEADTGLTLPGSNDPLKGQEVRCMGCGTRWYLVALIEVGDPLAGGWN
jgi:hypothetical protein